MKRPPEKQRRIRRIRLAVLVAASLVAVFMGYKAAQPGGLFHPFAGSSSRAVTVAAGQRQPNRLIHEKSPYLRQHAYNPVDWFPWGEEAFEKARRENKPIFLSVGYSTCYWCHVMERTVFENEEIAALMNEHVVSIKVDREERPDVDRVYMTALLAIAGSGGWPMSMFLTADLEPFYGGTYFPPEAFTSLLQQVHQVWLSNPDGIRQSSQELVRVLRQANQAPAATEMDKSVLTTAFGHLQAGYDKQFTGFGDRQKFPRPVVFNFLLRYHKRFGRQEALDMTLATLRKMAHSGMYDHVGGGFHRYSVDAQWRTPHFEKMLYDQAQLVWSYLDAYQITSDAAFATTARETLDYLIRELKAPKGAFYSAQDAESAPDPNNPEEKEEGAFYVWTREEIEEALGTERAKIFSHLYDVRTEGNALTDPQGEFKGENILYLAHPLEETGRAFGKTTEEIGSIVAESRRVLYERRSRRPRPHLDDKVLVAWNGLAISAFARAYQALDDPQYLSAATDAAEFILAKLYDPATRKLNRRYREGETRYDGQLDDYAFFVLGLLDLYEADLDIRWLQLAVRLTEKQIEIFYDQKNGGFFDTPGTDPNLLIRTREDYDGAEPAGNSIAAWNLLRLAQMVHNPRFRELAERTLASFGARLKQFPDSMPQMLVAVDFHLDKPKQVIEPVK